MNKYLETGALLLFHPKELYELVAALAKPKLAKNSSF